MRVYYRKFGKKDNVCILNVEYVEMMIQGFATDTWTIYSLMETPEGQILIDKGIRRKRKAAGSLMMNGEVEKRRERE